MTKEEIRNTLTEMGIETTTKLTKTQLQDMLDEAVVVDATPESEDCGAFGAFDVASPDCEDCPSLVACRTATSEKEAVKNAPKPKKETGPRTGKAVAVKSKYKDINELIEDIGGVEAGSMCLAFDKLLVVGATMAEFLETSASAAEQLNVQFRNEKSIVAHFTGRRKQGWVIDETATGIISVVDVNNDNIVPRSDTKAYIAWKAERDAAKAAEAEAEETGEAKVEEKVEEPSEEVVEEETQMDMAVNA
jgi:hypothetical protein